MSALFPTYHFAMLNDARRTHDWDKALRGAIRPGMRVLEIGTGGGLLAMVAARAGAAHVTTCEAHQMLADLAREVVARNGLQDSVRVVGKHSLELKVGVDLDGPADLMFCDNFDDMMFGADPLHAIEDARARLLKAGAIVLPAAVSVRVALTNWAASSSMFGVPEDCGFDLSPLMDFAPTSVVVHRGDPDLAVLSEAIDAFRFDLASQATFAGEQVELPLHALKDCEVNGIAHWLRLELNVDTVLEARPERGVSAFSNPVFYPLPRDLRMRQGEAVTVHARHDTHVLSMWVAP